MIKKFELHLQYLLNNYPNVNIFKKCIRIMPDKTVKNENIY